MNKNIVQARDYLETASAQRPDDAHILDSVGWAYYLSGDFKAAVTQFEHAVELMPDDVTINEHLGDAYWRVGREVEARYQWQRALSNKPEKEVAEGLNSKIAKRLPAFTQSVFAYSWAAGGWLPPDGIPRCVRCASRSADDRGIRRLEPRG